MSCHLRRPCHSDDRRKKNLSLSVCHSERLCLEESPPKKVSDSHLHLRWQACHSEWSMSEVKNLILNMQNNRIPRRPIGLTRNDTTAIPKTIGIKSLKCHNPCNALPFRTERKLHEEPPNKRKQIEIPHIGFWPLPEWKPDLLSTGNFTLQNDVSDNVRALHGATYTPDIHRTHRPWYRYNK